MIDRFERFTLAISEISRHLHQLTAEEMEQYGLKGPHAVYLLALFKYPEGVSAPKLCQLCGKDKSDVSRMMPILVEKGLVVKEGIYQNRYGGIFKLTETGKEAAEHIRRKACRAVELAGKDLSEETRNTFYAALESIAGNLRVLRKEGIPEE